MKKHSKSMLAKYAPTLDRDLNMATDALAKRDLEKKKKSKAHKATLSRIKAKSKENKKQKK